MDNGERPKWREEYLSVSALQKFPFAGQAAPSNGDWSHLGWAARSADDWDGYLILPTAGSDGKPMKGGDRNGVDHGVALRDMEVENQRAFMTILNERIGQLDTENSQKAARINDLQRALDRTKTLATKEEADQEVFKRLLEVQEAQIQELTTKVDESRAKLAKSLNEKSLSVAESEYSRLQIERLRRDKRELEDKLNAIAQVGGNVNVAPKKALESKVTAVANDLVFISMGKDDGILEGDEFTVYRGGVFVAKVMIDRSDRKWSAGKIVLKKAEPRVGDDVSNHILSPDPRTGGKLRIDAATADGSWIAIKPLSAALARGQVYAVTREQKFVALIQVTRDSEARVFNGIAAGRILPGDDVVFVGDPRAYFQALPAEVRQDLASRANQHTIRAKMGLKE
jgi:hypothetical protein